MPFDESKAHIVTRFIRNLVHTRGEWMGKPFDLQPWQEQDIIRPLFGEVREDGTRRYRTAYMEIPRKNGKTELMAAIGLYMTIADGEPGAEVYCCACDRDQASIIFKAAATMVRQNRVLNAKCKIIDSWRRIGYYPTGSTFNAISSEAASKHGYSASCIIYDELHAAPNRELWDVLKTSQGARRQPLMCAITTAGFERSSICWEQHEYAQRVNAGMVDDPSFLGVIYGIKQDEDWKDEAVWARCNPNLGVTVKLNFLRAEFKRALEVPAYQNTFRRLFLNEWTQQSTRWLDMDVWTGSAGVLPGEEEVAGRPCFVALDLSSTTDLTAAARIYPWDDGTFKAFLDFWIPAEGMRERIDRDRVPYDAWVRDGLIRVTPGRTIDQQFIRAWLRDRAEKSQVVEVGYDPWNSSQLVRDLEMDGFTLVEMRQGMASMSPAAKNLVRLLLEKKIHHGGNPVLDWMAGNVTVREDAAGNIKPDKATSTSRIDGIIALIMALHRAILHLGEEESVYEERGVREI